LISKVTINQIKGIYILTNFKPIIELGGQLFIIFALQFLLNNINNEKI